MPKFLMQVRDVIDGELVQAPHGHDGWPHTSEPVYVEGRGLVLVLLWRVPPPPIVDPPRDETEPKPKPSKKRKAKP